MPKAVRVLVPPGAPAARDVQGNPEIVARQQRQWAVPITAILLVGGIAAVCLRRKRS